MGEIHLLSSTKSRGLSKDWSIRPRPITPLMSSHRIDARRTTGRRKRRSDLSPIRTCEGACGGLTCVRAGAERGSCAFVQLEGACLVSLSFVEGRRLQRRGGEDRGRRLRGRRAHDALIEIDGGPIVFLRFEQTPLAVAGDLVQRP